MTNIRSTGWHSDKHTRPYKYCDACSQSETNIVDAIRWVLGEQKTKRLRSSKMEDVIFNGTSNVKPLGLCEVYLTIENNKGLLPVEFLNGWSLEHK